MSNERGKISGERQATYYVGLVLVIIGVITFFSVFVSAAMTMNQPLGGMMTDPSAGPGTIFIRAIVGIGLAILGSVLMNLGSRGLAGSGVVLDPQQARRDLEPWSRMAGGMVKDGLEETGLQPNGAAGAGSELSFDDKLRRLEKLHADGLLSEEEYRRKRSEILGEKW